MANCNFAIRIEHGSKKGLKISDGFSATGSRITTSSNRCVLFNILLNKFYLNFDKINNCLDLCCGSGIVGCEFLSCGAKECFFIDCDRKKIKFLEKTIFEKKLNGKVELSYLPSCSLFRQNNQNVKFDLIFFDPPYDNNFQNDVIKNIFLYELLSDNGILIVETKQQINERLELYKILHQKKLKNGAFFYFIANVAYNIVNA